MSLDDVPVVLILVGLVAYAVLAFADFGAGVWHVTPGDSEHGRRSRDHALHAMGPVWEANHVWLIFVLVVAWTAYPTAFGSIASTLVVPLFVAAVGIIGRGTAYALNSQSATRGEERLIGGLFAFSSVLTPFALGMVAGGIASGRVPVGNAAGDLLTSWWNPTSIVVGLLAVGTGIYLAAIYLAADAVRLREPDLVEEYRRRALVVGRGGRGARGRGAGRRAAGRAHAVARPHPGLRPGGHRRLGGLRPGHARPPARRPLRACPGRRGRRRRRRARGVGVRPAAVHPAGARRAGGGRRPCHADRPDRRGGGRGRDPGALAAPPVRPAAARPAGRRGRRRGGATPKRRCRARRRPGSGCSPPPGCCW